MSENDPLQAQITMREFQFFGSIIEKKVCVILGAPKFAEQLYEAMSIHVRK
jgi:hypothetical protein